jgi:hypothetical protein
MVLNTKYCSCLLILLASMSSFADSKYSVFSERTLDSDGPNQGLSAYELIKAFGGKKPIESPDLYPENHPSTPHIFEATDDEVGNHFVFVIHRDHDIDRDKLNIKDRQRNEIKAYGGSEKALKAYRGETFEYRWKFKLDDEISVSKNFTHIFQLKSVDDGVGTPILAITPRKRRGNDVLELGHAAIKKSAVIASHPLADVRGEWVNVICRVTYADSGSLFLSAKRLRDGKPIFQLDVNDIDMWRGTKSEHFVRPKWGLYRSLKDFDNLRAEEDSARFANFVVRELR